MTAPSGPRRQRRSNALAALVLAATAMVFGILGWTLVTVNGLTRGFDAAQKDADGVANVHRQLLQLQSDVVRLRVGGTLRIVQLHRDLLLQQLSAVQGMMGGDSAQQAKNIAANIRAIDWSLLESPPGPGPELDRAAAAVDERMQTIEREYKEFYDRQVRGFYRTTSRALAAKATSERMLGALVALTLVLALAWVYSIRRHSRSDLADAYEALRFSEERFRSLVQHSCDLTLVCDPDGVLRYVSPASGRILGVEDTMLTGVSLAEVIHADDRWAFDEQCSELSVTADGSGTLECRMHHSDGSFRWVEVTGTNLLEHPAVGGVVLNVRDVTDRKHLEAELRHAQKLESVGQLAAGIAHEINTPIQFIGDNVRFLGDAFGDLTRVVEAYRRAGGTGEATAQARALDAEVDTNFLVEEIPEAIGQTLDGVDRVAGIVRAMKAFAHPAADEKALADLNQAVRNTLVVANNETKYVADVVSELGELPLLPCHLGDVNQVLLNLVVNAAHAVAATVDDSGERGTITVRTLLDGGDAVIEVADTGTGIPADIADRVFEPFFTTKEVGVGTGQGLALAYSLVTDRHGGSITFVSEEGVGTTFTVRLPVGIAEREPFPTEVMA